MVNFIRIFTSFFILLSACSQSTDNQKPINNPVDIKGKKRILLLGASIGRNWNFPALHERIADHNYVFEYVGESGFDKSAKLTEILARQENKPEVVFLKECAAYFPGDIQHYQSLIKQWVEACRKAGVIPIPTTAVPVTRWHSLKKFAIDIVKLRNPFKLGNPLKPNRQLAIQSYNDWIRTFCAKNDLLLLDLEAAVRISEKDRYLRSDLATVDGLHLNQKGYQILDRIVVSAIEKVNWK